MGELHILNTGQGDITMTFNPMDTEETAKAIRTLKDMQLRGYAILVRLPDGTYTRAIEINAEHGQYVIMEPEGGVSAEVVPPKKRGRPKKRGIPIAGTSAVGVARSAGG